jgi:hypothetical protein
MAISEIKISLTSDLKRGVDIKQENVLQAVARKTLIR